MSKDFVQCVFGVGLLRCWDHFSTKGVTANPSTHRPAIPNVSIGFCGTYDWCEFGRDEDFCSSSCYVNASTSACKGFSLKNLQREDKKHQTTLWPFGLLSFKLNCCVFPEDV